MNPRYLSLLLLFLAEQKSCFAFVSQQPKGRGTILGQVGGSAQSLMTLNKNYDLKSNFIKVGKRKSLILQSTESSSSSDDSILSSNEESEILPVNGSAKSLTDDVSEVVDGTPVLIKGDGSVSVAIDDDQTADPDEKIIPASAAVGAITATLGFLYVRALGKTQAAMWNTLSTLLLEKFGSLNPYFFIPGVMTVGGLLIATIASNLKTPTFAVYDFVSGFSRTKVEELPPSRIHLMPLMALCLMTSSFGFSLGPEAPMVCAGGLTGASLARLFFGKEDKETAHRHQETLAYAGAAGAITASLGVPIAGSIFALEMTRACAGMSKSERVLSPAIMASVVALILVRAIYNPGALVGGHFNYGTIGSLNGAAMIGTAAASGVGGALLGTGFHKVVHFLKHRLWSGASPEKHNMWKRQLLVKGGIGLVVGLLATRFPQTLFWGEGSLQTMIDGQRTAFEATKHGLIAPLTSAAIVNPSVPYANGLAALKVGLVKLFSIALACAAKFPGGIIFPLFAAAPPFAHAFASFVGPGVIPVAVMCLMASLQASVTRTPLATALILALTASAGTELSVMLPPCLIASYLGVYVARRLSRKSYFTYSE